MKELILASQSPRRKMLLEQVGIPFTVLPSDVDETIDHNQQPAEIVQILSVKKAESVVHQLPEGSSAVVLAADTIVVLQGKVLGKPADRDDAFRMLQMLQDQWHEVMTGITLIDIKTGKRLAHVEKTRVRVRPLTPDAIRDYIDSGEPLDKAGAYAIQGLGALLVEKIDGCYSNVVGLPLYSVSMMLAEMGIHTPLDR
ncbi:MAG: septum formation inhibitor Maf [Thermoclostridium sp.]|nr:septum formation inhibitor Maf [Thermoclostridium sp.]